MTYSELIKNNGASTTAKALEQRARRLAARKGYRLIKVRTDKWYNPDGPYLLVHALNGLELRGLRELKEILDYLGEK